jgi:hypothetical protein
MSVAFHCGVTVWLTLRRVGNLVEYEGECGSEERSSRGMVDESDGCWAAIVAKRREEGSLGRTLTLLFPGNPRSTPRAGQCEKVS